MPLHHNNNKITVFSLYGFPHISESICDVIMCSCDVLVCLLLVIHIFNIGHYLVSFSCNVSINEFNEKNFNAHEFAYVELLVRRLDNLKEEFFQVVLVGLITNSRHIKY